MGIFYEPGSSTVNQMMKKMDYLPALGLGKKQQGITQLPDFKMQMTKKGLGYKGEKIAKDGKTLEDFFVLESRII